MKLSAFNYYLPKNLVAQTPANPRDTSRLMVLDRKNKTIKHKIFRDILNELNKGDILVVNDSKVFPARLIGKRELTGGQVEIFLLQKESMNSWQALVGGGSKKIAGQKILFKNGLFAVLKKPLDGPIWLVKFNLKNEKLDNEIDAQGLVPTPPYIKKTLQEMGSKKLKEAYQTIYAKVRGSVAAPTAGLHFTKKLLSNLKKKGVIIETVTLHVGYGTFAVVKEKNIEDHKLHAEWAEVNPATAKRLNSAKANGQRIVAVGTTATRVLEAMSVIDAKTGKGKLTSGKKWINIFIYPGYKFKFIDSLITNFHLPESTLLMLVSAFAKASSDRSALAGKQFIKDAYALAVKKKYRFFSFGDAMLIK